MKKAIVFDSSGTLIERYRVIKDLVSGELFTDINSLDLVDQNDSLVLVVLQYDTNNLLNMDSNLLLSEIIKNYNIDFDISFANFKTNKEEVKEILFNEKTAVISDITDGFPILNKMIPNMELCNGSAIVMDMNDGIISHTITSAGRLFEGVIPTVNELISYDYEIFLASGDRKGAINKLADILGVKRSNAHGSVSTSGKCRVVKNLQDDGYRVMMVGDGLNDVLAFEQADISVLTIEQAEEVSPKLMGKTDFVIDEITHVCDIDF